jgi:hypothetical protein
VVETRWDLVVQALMRAESFDSPNSPVPANGAPLPVLIRAGTPYSRMATCDKGKQEEQELLASLIRNHFQVA